MLSSRCGCDAGHLCGAANMFCFKCLDGPCIHATKELNNCDRKLSSNAADIVSEQKAKAIAMTCAAKAVASAAIEGSAPCQDLVDQWFNTRDEEDWKCVAANLEKIEYQLREALTLFEMGLESDSPERNIYAFTYMKKEIGAAIVYLCDLFWSAATDGYNSKAGILVHEVTHCSFASFDHAYGVSLWDGSKGCRGLPSDRATSNADTYEYFCEDAIKLALRGTPSARDLTTQYVMLGAGIDHGNFWKEYTIRVTGGFAEVTDFYELEAVASGKLKMKNAKAGYGSPIGQVTRNGFEYNDGTNDFHVKLLSYNQAFGLFHFKGGSGYVLLQRQVPQFIKGSTDAKAVGC
mmetsp:Transcript_107018/g.194754  ORF Transcript_107018/g.194754 Transcript_107018/m.194754 type:complete len:348 (-) Transcript_107018:138-1181(-)